MCLLTIIISQSQALCTRTFKSHTIIFFRSKQSAHRMKIIFGLAGLKAAELHGNLTQAQVSFHLSFIFLCFYTLSSHLLLSLLSIAPRVLGRFSWCQVRLSLGHWLGSQRIRYSWHWSGNIVNKKINLSRVVLHNLTLPLPSPLLIDHQLYDAIECGTVYSSSGTYCPLGHQRKVGIICWWKGPTSVKGNRAQFSW
mgnify:CR=1 FL=1